jgi:potassium channel subfamily K
MTQRQITNTPDRREWFALTAFPLFAGTFGPIASALNICALVQPWRSIVPPGATQDQGIDIDDPSWCVNF